MKKFLFEKADLKGSYLITSFFSEDNRGFFSKSFEKGIFEENGINFDCSEVFISSSSKNVIRGLHFQTVNPQDKLVGVISGKVYDVIVDLRKGSPSQGQWRGYYLSDSSRNSLFIPKGFAHGFISLSDESIVSYICSGSYDNKSDTGIYFNDPDIGIVWPVNDIKQITISQRDMELQTYSTFLERCGGL